MIKVAFAMLAAVLLSSCAEQLAQPQPRPANAPEMVKAAMMFKLKDPDSAKYKFPYEPFLAKTGRGPQWVMNFLVNGKNSFGGYTGYESRMAAFMDGNRVDWVMSYAENPFLTMTKPIKP